jgi:hypothetical protein
MSKAEFNKKGYTIVKQAISAELRDFITQYALFDEMQDYLPEKDQGLTQVPNAHSKYGDPVMETMLLHLQEIMEKNTGLDLYPTYSFYRVYRQGDILEKHIDRESCEISATLCFNYSYDDKEITWPIIMDGNPVVLEPGDIVIYKGIDLDHWRDEFIVNEEDWQVQGFFHFVDANGPYAEWKYDKRETIGSLHPKETKIKHTTQNYPDYIIQT